MEELLLFFLINYFSFLVKKVFCWIKNAMQRDIEKMQCNAKRHRKNAMQCKEKEKKL